MKLATRLLCFLLVLGAGCRTGSDTHHPEEERGEISAALPLKPLPLSTLESFTTSGANWQIFEDVYADYEEKQGLETISGTGVLANMQTEAEKAHIFTAWDHQDLELELEFLMPKGSNSGIYFQSRYEIQLFDSWGIAQPRHADCGGIYQRWDESRPEGEKGYEGHPPRINASRAPGLWQHFRILFRAPRFDANGNKVENARFEKVYHNGVLIHEDVEVTGPTRAAAFGDEVAEAPLMIQGDHGGVAFRNIRYKRYGLESLKLSDLSYTVYESNGDELPDFDTLKVVKTGMADSMNVPEVSGLQNHYAMEFEGTLTVPIPGEYLFRTFIDDGGDLFIDGKKVVHNIGNSGMDEGRGLITLSKGEHSFKLNFYQVTWRAHVTVRYEGPEIRDQILASPDPSRNQRKPRPILVEPQAEVEMVGGFVNYGEEKRTHVISVGDPAGIHYSYDREEGAILSCWKGNFADVTQMWLNRGHSQLLVPMNAIIETVAGSPIAQISGRRSPWPTEVAHTIGYEIDDNGRPIFMYESQGVSWKDQIVPNPETGMLERTLHLSGSDPSNETWCRIAAGEKVELLPNGLYRVDGKYYLSLNNSGDAEAVICQVGNQQELRLPVLDGTSEMEITYALLW